MLTLLDNNVLKFFKLIEKNESHASFKKLRTCGTYVLHNKA